MIKMTLQVIKQRVPQRRIRASAQDFGWFLMLLPVCVLAVTFRMLWCQQQDETLCDTHTHRITFWSKWPWTDNRSPVAVWTIRPEAALRPTDTLNSSIWLHVRRTRTPLLCRMIVNRHPVSATVQPHATRWARTNWMGGLGRTVRTISAPFWDFSKLAVTRMGLRSTFNQKIRCQINYCWLTSVDLSNETSTRTFGPSWTKNTYFLNCSFSLTFLIQIIVIYCALSPNRFDQTQIKFKENNKIKYNLFEQMLSKDSIPDSFNRLQNELFIQDFGKRFEQNFCLTISKSKCFFDRVQTLIWPTRFRPFK